MVLILCVELGWLQSAHHTWSGRDRWVWERGSRGRGSTGSTDGSGSSGCTSPCEERSLQAQGSPVLHAAPVPTQPCHGICSQVAVPELFWRWGWCPATARRAFGTLLRCHKTRSRAMVAGAPRTWRRLSPARREPCRHASPATGLLPLSHPHGASATTSRSADEKCHRFKAN